MSTQGFVQLERGCVPDEFAATLVEEIDCLHAMGAMRASGSALRTGRESTVSFKKGVDELDLKVHKEIKANGVMLQATPTLAAFLDDSLHPFLSRMQELWPELQLYALDQVKVTRAEHGSACLPMHFDTASSFTTRRMLTLVMYLSDESPGPWPSPAGALRVVPVPLGQPVDVDPTFGRVVMFGSATCLHRTMPMTCASGADTTLPTRRVLSLWFSGDASDAEAAAVLVPQPRFLSPALRAMCDGDDDVIAMLCDVKAQRKIAKIALSRHHVASIKDAFGDDESAAAAIVEHDRIIALLKSDMPPGFVRLLEAIDEQLLLRD
jgi:hypothetical protein